MIDQGLNFCVSPNWSTFRTFERLLLELTNVVTRWKYPAPAAVDESGYIHWGNHRWRVVEGMLEVELPAGHYMTVRSRAAMKAVLSGL